MSNEIKNASGRCYVGSWQIVANTKTHVRILQRGSFDGHAQYKVLPIAEVSAYRNGNEAFVTAYPVRYGIHRDAHRFPRIETI
jgi:hypothetical protein